MICPGCGRHSVPGVTVCGACGETLQAEPTATWKPQADQAGKTVRTWRSDAEDASERAEKTARVPFKNMHALMVLALTIISLGLFYPAWFLMQRDAFNSLDAREKLEKGAFIAAIILLVASIASAFVALYFESAGMVDEAVVAAMVSRFLNVAGGLVLLIESFRARRMLIEARKKSISWLATFILNIVYLQYKINDENS